jgi:hypothetical protein
MVTGTRRVVDGRTISSGGGKRSDRERRHGRPRGVPRVGLLSSVKAQFRRRVSGERFMPVQRHGDLLSQAMRQALVPVDSREFVQLLLR